MNTPLSLEHYFMTQLVVNAIPPETEAEPEYKVGFEFDISEEPEGNRRALEMHVTIDGQDKGMPAGYQILAGIIGVFSFPEDAPEEDRDAALIFNGSNILYGALRGYLGTVTGPFGCGAFVMPTVNLHEIVSNWLSDVIESSRPRRRRKSRAKK